MTLLPNDDRDLVNFLRQHRPEVPPAAADLENQIFQQVERLQTAPVRQIPTQRRLLRLLVAPSMIAASLVATVISYDAFVPVKPSPAELARLERFMESNWQGVVSDYSDSDVYSMTDSPNKL